METPERGSGTEAQGLFQIVPLRARGFNRPIGLAGPFDHRSGVEPRILPVEQLVQNEPVGCRPMARVAVTHCGPCWYRVRNGCEFCLGLQPVCLDIVEPRAVYVQSSRDVAVGLGSGSLLLAEEERCRPRIDKRSTTFAFDRLDIVG